MSERNSGLSASPYFGNLLVELADLQEGATVLDVGCGRGASLFPAAQKIGPQGHVTGIEIDEKDAEVVETRLNEQGVSNANVLVMDAWQMTFEDASFDNVLGGAVIGFLLEDVTQKLCPEISRVLKSGGRVGFSTWKVMEDLDWMLESLQGAFPEVPDSELNVYSRYTLDVLVVVLSQAGFQDITTHTRSAEFIYENKEAWWNNMQLYTWKPFYDKIAVRNPEELEEFKEATYQKLKALSKTNGVSFTISTHFVYGTK